ncbi:hypothetical protein SmJEL517_g01838 [Synchytrium microbalum]|uniref:Uncharacterized protein n=1 Tax=Synchytrium microbalum TaxID=1806994 RepID=A0A507C389_9FUNG|nr:uncharacterized protein SmJEL517_g01838 [Synchytrium microbalum]TPX35980.1 hypothetical protein SmJEL517_g01838 [Synchytrium microbalum]
MEYIAASNTLQYPSSGRARQSSKVDVKKPMSWMERMQPSNWRIPLWVLLMSWKAVFTGALALVIGLLMREATAVSEDLGSHLADAAMKSAYLSIDGIMGSIEDSMITMTENSLVNSLVNLDPNVQNTGISSIDMSTHNDVLGGPLYSSCYPYSQCAATGLSIGDISFMGYNRLGAAISAPDIFYLQDNSTYYDPVSPGRKLYTRAMNSNYNAIINSSLFLQTKKLDAVSNTSAVLLSQGWLNFKTVPFWGSNVTPIQKTFAPDAVTFTSYLFYYRVGWYGLPYNQSNSGHWNHAAWMAISVPGFESELSGLNPSTNGLIYIMNSDGLMISSSTPNISQIGLTDAQYSACSSPNDVVASSCKFLVSTYGNISAIPNLSPPLFANTASGQHLVSARWMLRSNVAWVIVSCIPRSDIYAGIDATTSSVIIATVMIGVVGGCVSAALFTFAITKPLFTLKKLMEDARHLDFNRLSKTLMLKQSLVAELASMQETFFIMIQRFSDGLIQHASLMAGSSAQLPPPSPRAPSTLRSDSSLALRDATLAFAPQISVIGGTPTGPVSRSRQHSQLMDPSRMPQSVKEEDLGMIKSGIII